MYRLTRLQKCTFQNEISFFTKVFSSRIINFRNCYKSGIFQDEDNFDEKPFSRNNSSNRRERFYQDEDNFDEKQFNRNSINRRERFNQDEDNFDEKPFNRHNSFNRRERFSYLDDVKLERNNKFNDRYFPKRHSHDNYRSNQNFGEKLLDSVKESAAWQENVEKYFYVEHPNVTNRSEQEVKSFRESLNMTVKGSNVPNPIESFSELSLPESLKEVVMRQGYSEPTAIQAQGWPTILSGRDMVGISQTGSGKTLVFALPAIIHAMNQSVESNSRECKPQILILGPTRELVQQILQVTNTFSRSCNLLIGSAYGGTSRYRQLEQLRGAHICVATPGRLIDFVSEDLVNLQKCSYLVLDEADRMLDMGFEPQIRKIVNQIRKDRQTVMFSATWPKEIQALAEDFLTDYVKVTVGGGELVANPNIKQNIYFVEDFDKRTKFVALLKELHKDRGTKVLVFAQTKRTVDHLSHHLHQLQIPAVHIHGDVSQFRRDEVLRSFRKNRSCVLIATDVAARGLDVTDVQHVINYDLPTNIEDYIHRIGRTARGTSSGESHSFFTPENDGLARDLVAVLKQANQDVDPELQALAAQRTGSKKGNPFYRQRDDFQRRRRYSY